MQIDSVC